MKIRRTRSTASIVRLACFCLFMLFLYGPMVVIGILSFQGPQGGLTFPLHVVSLHWFRDVFNPQYIGDFRLPFVRSLVLGAIAMALTVVIAFAAGLAYRKRFFGSNVLFYLTVASLITPSLLVSLGIGLLFNQLELQPHWLTSALGAHLTWTLPFGVLIMFAVFNRLDPAFEEAARDQGASAWQTLRHVVIPIVAPGLVGVALFGFTLSYDEYARTSGVSGEYNTLPAELVSVTTNNASPALYAVGTLTTVFSFTVIACAFLVIYIIRRRRVGRARVGTETVTVTGPLQEEQRDMSEATATLMAAYEARLFELERKIQELEARLQHPQARPSGRSHREQSFRLGVDVGGTFTDLLLINEANGATHTAKVLSTPEDSSIGVLNGIAKVCAAAGIDPADITHVMHGTTIATNTVLTRSGAKVGLVTTQGYRQILQIARSFVPGGLGGWVIYNKADPLAPLELTVEAEERISARGEVVRKLDEAHLRGLLESLKKGGVEALTICFINAYANGTHERRARAMAAKVMPGVPVSISSEVIPEMQEYERTETTVVNSYIRPVVSKYVRNLYRGLTQQMRDVQLHVLRSDGGLASVEAAESTPVNLLMSGPAGGVSGALWIAEKAGYKDLLTFDMGGTSTDVALIRNGVAQTRRETRVADVTVRASSIDVRSVGAGGGSIAYVPELTKALRVGPQSAGADPGPAAYVKGGAEPTVTDAHVVLGYLPSSAKLGGDMAIDRQLAVRAVQQIADAMSLPLNQAAEGIIKIVNENMFGALRLVSVEQGYDPRDFALIAFGGAGPLHANALGQLMGSWPVIIPPGPGVLCAYGDATTRVRDEASRTFLRRFPDTHNTEVAGILEELAEHAARALDAEHVPREDQTTAFQLDVRYHGQGLLLTIDIEPADLEDDLLGFVGETFDDMHTQLFTFALETDKELVNLRAVVQGAATFVNAETLAEGDEDAAAAIIETTAVFVDGADLEAHIYDRAKLQAHNRILGPAIVTSMDSTSLILPRHVGDVDTYGNILIRPIS